MSFPSELQALIEEGRVAVRGLIRVHLGSGVYGIWNGTGNYDIDGVTYVPNSVISVDDIATGLGSAAMPLTIELPASADYGQDPDRLAEIENEDYKGRPIFIGDAYFHPDTRERLHVEWLHEGYIDTIDHVTDESGQRKLVGHIETKALDNHRDGYRMASHEDQQLVSAGDKLFEHAAQTPFESFTITLD